MKKIRIGLSEKGKKDLRAFIKRNSKSKIKKMADWYSCAHSRICNSKDEFLLLDCDETVHFQAAKFYYSDDRLIFAEFKNVAQV